MKYFFSCFATALFSVATIGQTLSFPARYYVDTVPYDVSTYNYHTLERKDTLRNYKVDTSKPVSFDVLSKDSISFIPRQINNQSTNIRTTYSIDTGTLNLIVLIDSTLDTLYEYKCRNDSLIYCDYFCIFYVHPNKPYVGPPPYPLTMFVSHFPWHDSSNFIDSLTSLGPSVFSDSISTLDSIEFRYSYYSLKKSPISLSSKNRENQKTRLSSNQPPKLRFLNKGVNLDCFYDLLGKKVLNKNGSIKPSIKIVIEKSQR